MPHPATVIACTSCQAATTGRNSYHPPKTRLSDISMDNSLQVSEEAADPEMREVAADAYESLLRVKGHASS